VAGSCECGNEPFGFHTMRGISWLAEELSHSQEELCVMVSHSVGCSLTFGSACSLARVW
jgi:hypothetical protein